MTNCVESLVLWALKNIGYCFDIHDIVYSVMINFKNIKLKVMHHFYSVFETIHVSPFILGFELEQIIIEKFFPNNNDISAFYMYNFEQKGLKRIFKNISLNNTEIRMGSIIVIT